MMNQGQRFRGPPQLRPSFHAVQMRALTGTRGTRGLNTRTITGLGIALSTTPKQRLTRTFLGRIG
jgi:hypothetical protein